MSKQKQRSILTLAALSNWLDEVRAAKVGALALDDRPVLVVREEVFKQLQQLSEISPVAKAQLRGWRFFLSAFPPDDMGAIWLNHEFAEASGIRLADALEIL